MRILVKSRDSFRLSESEALHPRVFGLRNALLLWDPAYLGLHTSLSSTQDSATTSHLLDFLRVIPVSKITPGTGKQWPQTEKSFVSQVNELADKHALEQWPKPMLPGPREQAYKDSLLNMVELASEIEIYDPYFADKLLNHQKQLWLISRLIEDSPANIKIITREPREFKDSRFPDQERQNYEKSLEDFTARSQQVKCEAFVVVIKRFDPRIKVHNRAIRFLFSNGVACDHALENGIEAFGRDTIEDSELPPMANEAFGARRARWRLVRDKFVITAHIHK